MDLITDSATNRYECPEHGEVEPVPLQFLNEDRPWLTCPKCCKRVEVKSERG